MASDRIWGPKPPQSKAVSHGPGKAVGTDTVGAAVAHLHWEHPFHVQGENLQHKSTDRIHHHVTGSVYSGGDR